jgi:hypothetical protein
VIKALFMKIKSRGFVTFFLTLLISVNMYTQEYHIGYTMLDAVDSSRLNRQVRLHVYYPAALVITGTYDLNTPSRKYALPVHEAPGSSLKAYVSIRGGNH